MIAVMQIDDQVSLTPAGMEDQYNVFQWMNHWSGKIPGFADQPESWQDFQRDYEDFFFTGARSQEGRVFIIKLSGVCWLDCYAERASIGVSPRN